MSEDLISKQKVLDILEPRLKSAVYDSGSRGTLETQRFYSAIESVKTLPVLNLEESAAHICDNLCRHSHNRELTQDDLDVICDKCKIAEMVKSVASEQKIPYQKPEVLGQGGFAADVTYRNFIMGRFTGTK